MKVDANLYLDRTHFSSAPTFIHLDIGGDLHAEGAHFDSGDVRFDQANVKGKMFFEHSQVGASLTLADATVRELSLNSVSVGKRLDLSHARVETVMDLN